MNGQLFGLLIYHISAIFLNVNYRNNVIIFKGIVNNSHLSKIKKIFRNIFPKNYYIFTIQNEALRFYENAIYCILFHDFFK